MRGTWMLVTEPMAWWQRLVRDTRLRLVAQSQESWAGLGDCRHGQLLTALHRLHWDGGRCRLTVAMTVWQFQRRGRIERTRSRLVGVSSQAALRGASVSR